MITLKLFFPRILFVIFIYKTKQMHYDKHIRMVLHLLHVSAHAYHPQGVHKPNL
jgi:general stress protein CsbA